MTPNKDYSTIKLIAYIQKAWESYLLLVPPFEALASP